MRPLGCQSRSELALCAQGGNIHGTDLEEFKCLRFKFEVLLQFFDELRTALVHIVFEQILGNFDWERMVVGFRFV